MAAPEAVGPEAWVDDPTPGAPQLTVAAVARRLGVAPATLRTWDRRYGLGPTDHSPGAHRRYSPADVARLETMRQLTVRGVAPADAARLALAERSPSAGAVVQAVQAADSTPPGRGSGGRILRLPNVDARVRGLARASMGLDAAAVADDLARGVAADGVEVTWESLLLPVLVAIGDRWAATGDGVDVEHLLSACASGVFRQYAAAVPDPVNVRPVLLACAAGELHSLPLDVLAAALAERRIATRLLGAAVPVRAMASAVRRIGPGALVLWSQLRATASLAQLAAVPATRPPVAVIAGGPGWPTGGLPEKVGFAGDLHSAVETIGRAVRG